MEDLPDSEDLRRRIAELERETERLSSVEASLAKTERRFQQYLDLPGVLFLTLDERGRVALINDNGLDILGYRRAELVGSDWFTTCLPPRNRTVVRKLYSSLMKGDIEPSDYNENSVMKRDGSERVIAWNNAVTRNSAGEITGTISSGEDITDRLRAEKGLKDASEIINKSPAVTFLWQNKEGWPVEFVSDNVLALLGYTGAEFVSGSVSYAEVIHPDDLEMVTQDVAKACADPLLVDLVHDPYRVVAKDGTIKWIEDQTSLRRDDDGAVTHFRGIVLDITHRKAAEDALLQERNELRLALEKVKTLSGLLPICASCKKIRDDKGYWNQIESYILEHSEAEFSHGICPACAKDLYPEYPVEE